METILYLSRLAFFIIAHLAFRFNIYAGMYNGSVLFAFSLQLSFLVFILCLFGYLSSFKCSLLWYYRALEILQEINCSLTRKNKFSGVALEKLLNSNLSVKYSLTGHLLSTDITTDGFYDPGQVS